jgi:PhzF family phenazine biosynthesis protein
VWQFFELESAADVLAADSSKVRWPEFKAIGLFARQTPDHECDYEVRMLAPSSGMSEDPITGSLNAAIAKWMQVAGRLQKPYLVAQGTSIDRIGRVAVKADDDGVVWVGGEVHIVIKGHVTI